MVDGDHDRVILGCINQPSGNAKHDVVIDGVGPQKRPGMVQERGCVIEPRNFHHSSGGGSAAVRSVIRP